MNVFRYFIFFLFSCFLALAWPSSSQTTTLITAYDNKALSLYNQLKNQYLQKTDPLIIAWGNRLTFYYHHKMTEYPILPSAYTELKTISHTVLAMFALFHPNNQFPKNYSDVKEFKHLVQQIEKSIHQFELSPAQQKRQIIILQATQNYLKTVLNNKTVEPQSLSNFFQPIKPFILANINDATRIEIDAINQQMMHIQQQLTPSEQRRLFVVIPVSKMPRQDNIIGLYFEKYFATHMDSEHLIYAEGLSDTKDILKLVGTWQIETELSNIFFNNPQHMKKDILGPNAQQYLQQCHRDTRRKRALIC